MKYLVLDTETTGLPSESFLPHIVQLSMVLFEEDVSKYYDEIIYIEEDVLLTEESVAIHGITRDMIRNGGKNINEGLDWLFEVLYEGDVTIVGHNIDFDIYMIKLALQREQQLDLITLLENTPTICTMKSSINLCQLKRKSDNYKGKNHTFKYPKLSELYQHCFQTPPPSNTHNSLVDTIITTRCFIYIQFHIDPLLYCDNFIELFNLNCQTIT